MSAVTELSDLPNLRCCDGSHTHISNAELAEGRARKRIELGWLREPGPHRVGIVRQLWEFPFRGLSCQVGSPLAIAVQQENEIGQVMLADIKGLRLKSERKERNEVS